jgi:hypothetical protein
VITYNKYIGNKWIGYNINWSYSMNTSIMYLNKLHFFEEINYNVALDAAGPLTINSPVKVGLAL